MKSLFFLVFLITLNISVKGQNRRELRRIINDGAKIIIPPKTRPPLLYLDRLASFEIEGMGKAILLFLADTIFYNRDSRRFLVFSHEERKIILQQINLQKQAVVPKKLFTNSIRISSDTINSIFRNKNDIASKWKRFYKIYGHDSQYWSFSKPILLKDKTVCLFYYSQTWGPRGGGEEYYFNIYIKEGGVWRYFFSLDRSGVT